MQKTTSVFLLFITVILIGYTLYYSSTHQAPVISLLSSPLSTDQTEASTTTVPIVEGHVHTLATKSGKTITITETNPSGQSLSTVVITSEGFASNTPITLEINKLTKFFLTDINNDGFEELVLISTAQGSGSYGEAILYTTSNDQGLTPVAVPQLKEEDTKKGGLFEGYLGHDLFSLTESNTLLREFPTYMASDTESNPTGPIRKIIYTINTKSTSTPFVIFTKETQEASTTKKI